MTINAGGLTAEHLGRDVSIPLGELSAEGQLISIEHCAPGAGFGFVDGAIGATSGITVRISLLRPESHADRWVVEPGQVVCFP